jgi:hypothetical protein
VSGALEYPAQFGPVKLPAKGIAIMDKGDLHVSAKPVKFPVHVKQSHGDDRLDCPVRHISVTSELLQLLPPFRKMEKHIHKTRKVEQQT